MKNYVDITLLPDAEISLYFLWKKLYQQVHLAFAEVADENGRVNLGSAFPDYRCDDDNKKYSLGHKLRIFAPSEDELKSLNLSKWLDRLSDYVHITKIRNVPDAVKGYASFRRLQSKVNIERLARRRAKRAGISNEEAMSCYKKHKVKYIHAPFIRIESLSTGHYYPLFIGKEETDKLVFDGGFSTYGLSSICSVPIF